MSSGLILILIVTGAYLAAHVVFERVGRRFMIVSGAEYLLLGMLLGPYVSGFISASVVGGFSSFMTLAIGWMGASVGAQFYVPRLVRTLGTYYRIAFVEAFAAFFFTTGIMTLAFLFTFDLRLSEVVVPAATMGAIATTSAAWGVRFVAERLERKGPIVRQLQVVTAVDSLVAIVAFGLLLCFAHPIPTNAVRAPTAAEWALISIGIGVVSGLLFHLFLFGERSIDRLFIGLAGAIILSSGAAAYLRLSPLLPALLIGAILVNTSRNRRQIQNVLSTVERPLYFVLLIFAGAAWRPSSSPEWLILVLLFVLLRYVGKVGGARFAARINGALPELGSSWGRALLAPGPLAVAIALNYQLFDTSLLPHVVFTATIVSVLVIEAMSARLVRSVLPEGQRGDREAALAAAEGGLR